MSSYFKATASFDLAINPIWLPESPVTDLEFKSQLPASCDPRHSVFIPVVMNTLHSERLEKRFGTFQRNAAVRVK